MSGFIMNTIEGFVQDKIIGFGEDYAGEHFQPTSDPFYQEVKDIATGETKQIRRRLPDNLDFTKQDSKNWKSIQGKAWSHDRSICGCCCWTSFIGWAPIVAILPIIGPILMYSVHRKLIMLADKKFQLPSDLKAKMYANISVDLVISLVPIMGSIFTWLNACSTRNAEMIYNFIVKRAMEQQKRKPNKANTQYPPRAYN